MLHCDDDNSASYLRLLVNYLSSNPLLDVFSRSGGGVRGADELAAPETTSLLPLLAPVLFLMTITQGMSLQERADDYNV